jgi:hypothetical protein
MAIQATARRRIDPHRARAANAARQSAWRSRQRVGVACYTVTIDAAIIDMLVRLHWLADDQATDRRAVGEAITHLLADAAKA